MADRLTIIGVTEDPRPVALILPAGVTSPATEEKWSDMQARKQLERPRQEWRRVDADGEIPID